MQVKNRSLGESFPVLFLRRFCLFSAPLTFVGLQGRRKFYAVSDLSYFMIPRRPFPRLYPYRPPHFIADLRRSATVASETGIPRDTQNAVTRPSICLRKRLCLPSFPVPSPTRGALGAPSSKELGFWHAGVPVADFSQFFFFSLQRSPPRPA